jgi:hypothetical protein
METYFHTPVPDLPSKILRLKLITDLRHCSSIANEKTNHQDIRILL